VKKIIAADLFCGAGGTSTGLARACQKMGFDLDLLAVNHWDIAISTHTKNHPDARHICGAIDTIRPEEIFPGGRLNLLVASPECTHFSNARGNKPMTNQKRATAWDILNWLQKLYIDNVLIENVKEFKTWGPLGVNGRPLKSMRGSMFEAFLASIRALGYNVEHRVLNAADYGDPTTRERLFIIARRNNKKIVWPTPSHSQVVKGDMFDAAKVKWRSAREIIDWSIESKSIFTRKKPLAPATLRRIEAGLKKFGGQAAEPFIVILRRHADAQSIDEPIPTVTGSGSHHALCEPFIVPFFGEGEGQAPRTHSVDEPLPTVTGQGAGALIEPFIMPLNHGDGDHRSYSVDDPMKAITSVDAWSLIQPFMVEVGGPAGRSKNPHSIEEPMKTLIGQNHTAIVEPFIIPQFSEQVARSIDDPLNTVTTTSRGIGLCEPYLVQLNGQSNSASIDNPLPTVTGMRKTGLVEPYLVRACHGEHDLGAWPVDEPVRTITAKLVTPDRYGIDIRFRMLQPHELSAAMGFPEGYEFTGNRENVVKQIGNAVCINLAEALCTSLLKAA
jgi:DNA (cytosine-5)-methyltransferase 1